MVYFGVKVTNAYIIIGFPWGRGLLEATTSLDPICAKLYNYKVNLEMAIHRIRLREKASRV